MGFIGLCLLVHVAGPAASFFRDPAEICRKSRRRRRPRDFLFTGFVPGKVTPYIHAGISYPPLLKKILTTDYDG